MRTFRCPTRARRQRGAATLVVALLLLFGMTLTAFYMNRGLIFEQRTSANQYRATRAFEMAEAGLEWAVARLNDDLIIPVPAAGTTPISPCRITGAAAYRFADLYLPMHPVNGFTAAAHRAGCSIAANGQVTCSCPNAGNTVLASDDDPRFTVTFSVDTAADPWAVTITSYGCTNAGTHCDPASAATPDGVAVVRATYKMAPIIPNAPGAGLVAGAAAIAGGNMIVHNTDPESNGITINSGTAVDLGGGTSVTTLPGTPPRASVLDNDPTLAALTTADVTGDLFFQSFFGGSTMAEYKDSPKTWLITGSACPASNRRCTQCNTAAGCGTAISTAYNSGRRQFWADTDVSWSTANLPTIGTLGAPGTGNAVFVASSADIALTGTIVAYGMFYAATASATDNWDAAGGGGAKVFGAFISRGTFNKGTGTLDLIYDPNVFGPGGGRGQMVRVPGSWRDSTNDL